MKYHEPACIVIVKQINGYCLGWFLTTLVLKIQVFCSNNLNLSKFRVLCSNSEIISTNKH